MIFYFPPPPGLTLVILRFWIFDFEIQTQFSSSKLSFETWI
ncbi:hypothetical protein AALP_AA7G120500 [Arabis alpina]|uniref:Uncharacterized protein n=1 Tax=Arabis alpina TaxID=50452 RepID=A0A087GHI3_ARAAL|nr:hypothetical protein AALP_AA7G120500 [Arabis alpina]